MSAKTGDLRNIFVLPHTNFVPSGESYHVTFLNSWFKVSHSYKQKLNFAAAKIEFSL